MVKKGVRCGNPPFDMAHEFVLDHQVVRSSPTWPPQEVAGYLRCVHCGYMSYFARRREPWDFPTCTDSECEP